MKCMQKREECMQFGGECCAFLNAEMVLARCVITVDVLETKFVMASIVEGRV